MGDDESRDKRQKLKQCSETCMSQPVHHGKIFTLRELSRADSGKAVGELDLYG